MAQALEQQRQAVDYTNAAADFYHKRQFAQAMDYCNRALALNPQQGIAYYYRGLTHFELGNEAQMYADLERAIQLEHSNVRVLEHIAFLLGHLEKYLQAIPLLHRVVELDPGASNSWCLLGQCYYKLGKSDSAKQILEHALQKFPDHPILRLVLMTFLPPIPKSKEEIEQTCSNFLRNLDTLIEEGFTLDNPVHAMPVPFYHAYYGVNCKPIMEKMAQFFLSASPGLAYVAPHCNAPRRNKNKLRIGFMSEFMHAELINQFFERILEGMAGDEELEVVIFSNSAPTHPKVQEIKGKVHKYVHLSGGLEDMRKLVGAEEIDVLMYLEIGVGQNFYYLAYSRLAPIQCVWGGHPITTGIPSIDYFFTTRIAEAENAHEHYSETPILLDHSLAVFTRPQVKPSVPSRRELGLPEGVRLYSCPVQLFKIHPDMDTVFVDILRRDPQGCILLFYPERPLWKPLLEARFAHTIPADLQRRIAFMPFVKRDVFLDMLRAVDCVLDPFHFSFGSTAYLALSANVPFVTWPGEFMRGRTGIWMYERMGMPEMIAPTHEAYAELAVKLANDKAFYAEMSEKIRKNSYHFIDNAGVIGEFTQQLKTLSLR